MKKIIKIDPLVELLILFERELETGRRLSDVDLNPKVYMNSN